MNIANFFKNLEIEPKNIDLYHEALTHATFVNEKRKGKSYQRLEFIGDALLDNATALYMFNKYPDWSEGKMTMVRSKVVSAFSLASFSRKMGLNKMMKIGKGAEEIRENEKTLSDLFESISAAIYLDLGQNIFNEFMKKNLFKKIDELKDKDNKSPKSILQEYLQMGSNNIVNYISKENLSSDGDERFESKVLHEGILLGSGKGRNTKLAETEAAKNALKKLRGKNEIN